MTWKVMSMTDDFELTLHLVPDINNNCFVTKVI